MTGRPAAQSRILARLGSVLPFEPVLVRSVPGDPTRCMLYEHDGTMWAVIGKDAHAEDWDHAVHHAERGFPAMGFMCRRDVPCGYEGDPSLAEDGWDGET